VSREPKRLSTVPLGRPPRRATVPAPPRTGPAYEPPTSAGRMARTATRAAKGRRQVGRIIDQSDSSLLDVLDSLLNRGVVLNADIILALANVDLVYLRLSALLCAADRVLPNDGR
jgi:hypothetical protein